MKDTIRYSESFKQKVVNEISKGKFISSGEASQAYGISGSCTVRAWIKKYGRTDLLPRVIRVESEKDIDEIKALKKHIAELQKTVTELAISDVMNKAYFEIACDDFGITDKESFKKKVGAKLSSESGL
jgi:transposase-like protein